MVWLTISQLRFLADVARDIGQIFLAGWVISPMITEEIDFVFLFLGLTVALIFWYIGLDISRKVGR